MNLHRTPCQRSAGRRNVGHTPFKSTAPSQYEHFWGRLRTYLLRSSIVVDVIGREAMRARGRASCSGANRRCILDLYSLKRTGQISNFQNIHFLSSKKGVLLATSPGKLFKWLA